MATNLASALMELRRRAQLQGRPLSQNEISAATQGWAESAAERNARDRALDINQNQFAQTLAFNKQTTADQMRLAEDANKRADINTGVSMAGNAAMLYGIGKQAGWWGAGAGGGTAGTGLTSTGLPVGGVEAGTTLGTASAAGGGSTVAGMSPGAGAGLIAAIIVAADMARQKWGELEKPYGERSPWGKFTSAPVTGGVPALGETIGLGESNDLMRGPNRLARMEEKLVGEPLDKALSGDIGGSLKSFGQAVLDTPRDAWNASVGAVIPDISCIIITACTDPHSPEVQIAREYRDKFLDQEQLRGYYAIAEKVVPFLNCSKSARKTVKKWFVDRLVDYGAVALGKQTGTSLRSSWIVSRLFLALCRTVGMILPRYVRQNGEVY